MAMVSVRRQGGAAIMTIPSDVMKALGLGIGAKLDVSAVGGTLQAKPRDRPLRKRYTLEQLLVGATPESMEALADETAWAREGEAVGREL